MRTLKTFRRSVGTRLLSVGCVALFAALEIYHLATGGGAASLGGILLGGLLAISVGATVLNLGDRYRVDEEGIGYANPLLARLGLRLDRRVAWREVVSVRAHRGLKHGVKEEKASALFLTLASGRRFVIDSVDEIEEIHRLVASHLPARAAPDAAAPAESSS